MKELQTINERFDDVTIKLSVFEDYAVEIEYTNSLTKRRKHVYILEQDLKKIDKDSFRNDVVFTGKKMKYIISDYTIHNSNISVFSKNTKHLRNYFHADDNKNHVVFLSDLEKDKQLYNDIFIKMECFYNKVDGWIPHCTE